MIPQRIVKILATKLQEYQHSLKSMIYKTSKKKEHGEGGEEKNFYSKRVQCHGLMKNCSKNKKRWWGEDEGENLLQLVGRGLWRLFPAALADLEHGWKRGQEKRVGRSGEIKAKEKIGEPRNKLRTNRGRWGRAGSTFGFSPRLPLFLKKKNWGGGLSEKNYVLSYENGAFKLNG